MRRSRPFSQEGAEGTAGPEGAGDSDSPSTAPRPPQLCFSSSKHGVLCQGSAGWLTPGSTRGQHGKSPPPPMPSAEGSQPAASGPAHSQLCLWQGVTSPPPSVESAGERATPPGCWTTQLDHLWRGGSLKPALGLRSGTICVPQALGFKRRQSQHGDGSRRPVGQQGCQVPGGASNQPIRLHPPQRLTWLPPAPAKGSQTEPRSMPRHFERCS